jgi:hypothetical protein
MARRPLAKALEDISITPETLSSAVETPVKGRLSFSA